MRLTVVGCSGSLPGPDSPASCYLVEQDGFCLVLDLGSGALGALQRHVRPADIGAVLVSHLHADHCLDLCPMYVALRYGPDESTRRAQPLPVYGPAGTADRIATANGAGMDGLAAVIDFREVRPGRLRIGPFEVTAVRTAHPVDCHAVRLEAGGRVLAYTADTGPSPDVEALAAGADLLLAEASFVTGVDNRADLHLTGRQAGQMARRSGARRLVVTHVPPWYHRSAAVAEACAEFDGPCSAAEPEAVLQV